MSYAPSLYPQYAQIGFWGGAALLTLGLGLIVWAILHRTREVPAMSSDKSLFDQSINVTGTNSGTISRTYNNTINQTPKPEVRWSPKRIVERDNGYDTSCEFEVVTPFPVKGLWVEVFGEKVSELFVSRHSPGSLTLGWTGQRDTYSFTTLNQAQGKYTLSFRSQSKETRITYGFES